MYPYHNQIRRRIRSGDLLEYYYTEDYPGIGRALVLVFRTPPYRRPIRPERFAEYLALLSELERRKQPENSG